MDDNMFIPVIDTVLEMNPTEFEKYALQILQNHIKGLNNVKFIHNKVVEAYDGNYQLDGYIEFEVMGVLYKTIVECKHYKYPISREIVQKVYDNLRAIGAQKGIVVSTSNFQSGAIDYAKAHGIALIQMTETEEIFYTRCHYSVVVNHPYVPRNGGEPYIGVMIGRGTLIKRLRIVKRLLRCIPVSLVCFSLKCGQIIELRSFFGLYFTLYRADRDRFAITGRYKRISVSFIINSCRRKNEITAVKVSGKILLLDEMLNIMVTLNDHRKRGSLHSADIQLTAVTDGEQPRAVHAHKPVCFRPGIACIEQAVISGHRLHIGERLADSRLLKRGYP